MPNTWLARARCWAACCGEVGRDGGEVSWRVPTSMNEQDGEF
jgi:hypothetical protein